jgi:EAL domain-containing protein (putative c-di-GMP-specific phosphodiesterase class I)
VAVEKDSELSALQQALAVERRRAQTAEMQVRWIREALEPIPEALALFDHAQAAATLALAREAARVDSAPGAAIEKAFDERRQLTLELKTALAEGEFEIWLQPQADLSGAVFGFEALTRWRHPQRGLIPPSVFIPLAEESGEILEFDAWVLRACCREAALWRRDLRIAVNISTLQFSDENFVERVRDILRDTGLPPQRLELEVTESVLVADSEAAAGVLRRLKAMGLSVALDDFGAGYSSLSYLQSLPFDRLKIDRCFVSRLKRVGKSQAIIRAIVELGRGLGLSVIAEGVETRTQLAVLREIGCSQFQGFLIGRPQPLQDIVETTRGPGAANLMRFSRPGH